MSSRPTTTYRVSLAKKHLQKIGDLSSRDFAEDRGVSLAEVNKAIHVRNYEEYERGR